MAAWTNPTMTSNVLPAVYAVSASSEYTASYAAWKAMDGSVAAGNYWNTSGPSNPAGVAWWKIYMGNGARPICVTTLTIKNLAPYGYHDFKLQGSNDNSNWTDIYTGHCDDNSNVQTYASLGNTEFFLYYRIWCTTCYSIQYLVVTEITMSGETKEEKYNYISAKRDRLNRGGVSLFGKGLPVKIYPVAQNDTYVKATGYNSANYYPYFATDPTKSLTGTEVANQWYSANLNLTNQRFHIDIGAARTVQRIYYENAHNSGEGTTLGVKFFTLWGSNIEVGTFDDLTYANDEGWTQLTTSQHYFDQHTGSDVADPKYIDVIRNRTPYRYYAFKFLNNYGGSPSMGVRRLVLQTTNDYLHNRRDRLNMRGVSTQNQLA